MTTRRSEFLGILLLTLIWGTTWAAIRASLAGIPPLTGVALRFGAAGLLLWAVGKARGVRFGRAPHERRLWIINAGCTFAGSYGIVFWAEQWLPSGMASVLFATFPLWTALLAPFFLPGGRISPRALAGVLLGFAGVALIFWQDLAAAHDGALWRIGALYLVAPLLSAVANLATKRWGGEVPPISAAAVPMLLGAAMVLPVALVVESPATAPFGARALLALAYLAVVGSAVAFSVYYWLLRRSTVLRLSMITYTAPVVAVAVGAALFGERLGWPALAGAGLVLGGVWLTVAVRHEGR